MDAAETNHDCPSKRSKASTAAVSAATEPTASTEQGAKTAAAFIPFLSADDSMPPTLPEHEDMEEALLILRKQALLEEYFGENSAPAVA